MQTTIDSSRLPSAWAGLLRSLCGHRIVSVTRYTWRAPREVARSRGVPTQAVFSWAPGPVAIAFDTGLILGMASDPSLQSVKVWVECGEAGQSLHPRPLATNEEFTAIPATDPEFADAFWRSVLGSKVDEISLLVRTSTIAKVARLPNEVGVCFSLDSGARVVASHGLHNDSDDFSIIPEAMIQSSLLPALREVPLPQCRV